MIIEQLTLLIDLIYASAIHEDGWAHVLDTLRQRLGCDSASMQIYSIESGQIITGVQAGAFALGAQAYARHYADSEAYFDKLKAYGADEYMIVFNGREAARWPQPADCGAVEKSDNQDISGFMFKAADSIVHIAVHCSESRRSCDFPETLEVLVPHLQRAMLVSRQRSVMEQRLESMEQVINQFGPGVILIDGRGHAAFLNRRAREVVKARNGLNMVDGELAGTTVGATREIRNLVIGSGFTGKEWRLLHRRFGDTAQ